MAKSLTTKAIEALKPGPTVREIPDGRNGLAICVQTTGTLSWIVRGRVQGKHRKFTLGKFPDLGLADARKKAESLWEAVDEGKEPPKPVAKPTVDLGLVETVIEEFIAKGQTKIKSSTAKENERLLRVDVLPVWKGRTVRSIKRSDVVKLLDEKALTAPGAANHVRAILSRFFNWCLNRDYIEANPVTGVEKPGVEKSRDRTLDHGELTRVWRAAEKMAYPFGRILQLLILTGQRRDEVAESMWGEFDLEAETPVWAIPSSRAKNDRPHMVPLSPAAVDLLQSLPVIQSKAGWLFTTIGERPVSGHSKAKEIVDRVIGEQGEPLDPWTVHDIRRSVASGMAALRVAPHVIEAVLNHQTGKISGVAKTYNRYDYFEEKKQALFLWANSLAESLQEKGTTGNVLKYSRK